VKRPAAARENPSPPESPRCVRGIGNREKRGRSNENKSFKSEKKGKNGKPNGLLGPASIEQVVGISSVGFAKEFTNGK